MQFEFWKMHREGIIRLFYFLRITSIVLTCFWRVSDFPILNIITEAILDKTIVYIGLTFLNILREISDFAVKLERCIFKVFFLHCTFFEKKCIQFFHSFNHHQHI